MTTLTTFRNTSYDNKKTRKRNKRLPNWKVYVKLLLYAYDKILHIKIPKDSKKNQKTKKNY